MGKIASHFCTANGRTILFDLGACDKCGGPVQEANAITTTSAACLLRHRGIEEHPAPMPPEVVIDDNDEYACEGCYA